ncbi:MAG: hypothetical protein AB7F19_02890 [Candidatus Babeliales bacterium]
MVTHTRLLSGLLGLMTITGQARATVYYLQDDAWFNTMHKNMQEMHDRMRQSMQEMQQMFDERWQSMAEQSKSSGKDALMLDATDTQVIITLNITGAVSENMKAERNLDTIIIEIPHEEGTSIMKVSKYALSLQHTQENKNADGSSANRHTYLERTLPHEVDMNDDINIEHVEESNTLQITLSRKHKKKSPQRLPITKK